MTDYRIDPLMTEAPALTAAALDDIGAEREAQYAKWGPQHHPDGTTDSASTRYHRDTSRKVCDIAASRGQVTWAHILTEEFFEAMCEEDLEALRKELIQVAAVASAWVEDIDSRVD